VVLLRLALPDHLASSPAVEVSLFRTLRETYAEFAVRDRLLRPPWFPRRVVEQQDGSDNIFRRGPPPDLVLPLKPENDLGIDEPAPTTQHLVELGQRAFGGVIAPREANRHGLFFHNRKQFL